MIGQKFGRWTVVSFAGKGADRHFQYLCLCDCGVERIVPGTRLRTGISKSCGCARNEYFAKKRTTHGGSRSRNKNTPNSREYRAWCDMKTRCRRDLRYSSVSICEEWINSFERFYSDMGDCPRGHTLDRINPFSGYNPENCRWATWKEQANNTKAYYKAIMAIGRPLKEDECLFFANGADRSNNFAIVDKQKLPFFQKLRAKRSV